MTNWPYLNKSGQSIHIIQLKYSQSIFSILKLPRLTFYLIPKDLLLSHVTTSIFCEVPEQASCRDTAQLQIQPILEQIDESNVERTKEEIKSDHSFANLLI